MSEQPPGTDTGTENDAGTGNDTDTAPPSRIRNWRTWRIPNRIYGRIRTSTVLFGICFVLTSLLYIQVNEVVTAANKEAVQGPVAVDPSQLESEVPQQTYRSTTTTTVPPSTTVDPSTTSDPSGSEATSGEPGAPGSSAGASTTQDPTFFPGLTVPPQLRSLIPPAPQASTTGTP